MAPRSQWSGSLSFGLVNVPVKLYGAVSEKDVRFNMIHAACGGRISMKRFCANEGVEIPNDQIVKGYEVEKGRFVTVTAEELAAVEDKAISIESFCEVAEIDPVYFDKSYYLGPEKGAGKAYGLLLAAMKKSGKAAIARITLRGKQQLACVRVLGNVLSLVTLNYHDEVNASGEIAGEIPEVSERELSLAERLIEAQTATFDPAAYRDEHRAKVLALIERKAAGEAPVIASEAPAAQVIDLAAALEASLARKAPAPAAAPAAEPKKKPKKAA